MKGAQLQKCATVRRRNEDHLWQTQQSPLTVPTDAPAEGHSA